MFDAVYRRMAAMKKFASLKGKAFLFLLLLFFLWFLNFAGRTMFAPVLPLIEDEYLISHAKASSIFIFQAIGYGTSMFFSGLFSGVFGYKKSIVLSLIVSAFAFLLVPFAKVFNVLYVLSFVIGMATGMYIPAVIPLITHYFEENIWGKAIAIHDSAASIGVFGAPIIAIFLLQFFGWRNIFSVLGIVFIIAALIFYVLFDELKVPKINMADFRKFIRRKALWVMSIIWMFAASTSLGIYSVIPLYPHKGVASRYRVRKYYFRDFQTWRVCRRNQLRFSGESVQHTEDYGFHIGYFRGFYRFCCISRGKVYRYSPFLTGDLYLRVFPCRTDCSFKDV